jgi:hypothetical protein
LEGKDILRLVLVTFFAILTVLTARTSYQANYINYDNAKEFLVYAHGAAVPKRFINRCRISPRASPAAKTSKSPTSAMPSTPTVVFPRFSNKLWLKDNLTRDLLNYPLVISDDTYLSQTNQSWAIIITNSLTTACGGQ